MLKNIAKEKVKRELEKKAIERQRIINERKGTPKALPNDEGKRSIHFNSVELIQLKIKKFYTQLH